jgi:DNA-binding NarL/FixJ family response regulator
MSFSARVAIIDADDLIREGRGLLLQSQAEFQVVYESGDPNAALAALPEYLVDVVLVELRTPGWLPVSYIDALSAAFELAGNEAAIVATASFMNEELELEILRAGASGVFAQEESGAALIKLVKTLGNGGQAFKRDRLVSLVAKSSTVAALESKLAIAMVDLDLEQRKVLQLMVDGKSDSAIAVELDLTRYRVTKFIESLRAFGNFRTRIQLAIALIELGFHEN